MRSVVVVLPASMCAAMPMLRVRSIGYCRLGELGDFGAAGLAFSNTASMIQILFLLSENENAPKYYQPSGRSRKLYYYQRKCANALLAWAILCTSSRLRIALPCP